MPPGLVGGSLRARQAGCWTSHTGWSPRGELWWRLRFPALGVGLSSCFLLIALLDNATVTQLLASWMNNSRFVQGQLGNCGCTSHLLPGSQLGGASGILNGFPAWSECPGWVDFRLLLFGFPKHVLTPLFTADPELLWLHADQLPACHPSQALPDLPYSWFEVQWFWCSP